LREASIGVTKISKDPLNAKSGYDEYSYDVSSDRQSYVLRAQLEDATNPSLNDDFDSFVGGGIGGINIDCTDTAAKPYYCVQF
jgi:hypothetical protein